MQTILINIGILLAIFLIYYVDFFGWFVGGKALTFSIVLVVLVFIVAWKILGNPFAEDKKNDDE